MLPSMIWVAKNLYFFNCLLDGAHTTETHHPFFSSFLLPLHRIFPRSRKILPADSLSAGTSEESTHMDSLCRSHSFRSGPGSPGSPPENDGISYTDHPLPSPERSQKTPA